MSTVNEVNMAKWIVALRSGKYRQGLRQLRNGDAFCCLGVACDISDLGAWRGTFYTTNVGASEITLPAPVSAWLGTTDNPEVDHDLRCVSANDNLHWDFNHIAAALEGTHLPGKKAEEILAGAA